MAMDMSAVIQPKSDQINADDLIGGNILRDDLLQRCISASLNMVSKPPGAVALEAGKNNPFRSHFFRSANS